MNFVQLPDASIVNSHDGSVGAVTAAGMYTVAVPAGIAYVVCGAYTSGAATVTVITGLGTGTPGASGSGEIVVTTPNPQAIVFATDGTYNYYAFAPPGTSQATAAWKVMRVLLSDGVTTTWANGNANYTNVGTAAGLSALSYS